MNKDRNHSQRARAENTFHVGIIQSQLAREKILRDGIVGYDVISENRSHEIAVGSKPYRWFHFFYLLTANNACLRHLIRICVWSLRFAIHESVRIVIIFEVLLLSLRLTFLFYRICDDVDAADANFSLFSNSRDLCT